MPNYNIVIDSKFKPISYEEMLKPVVDSTNAHKEAAEQFELLRLQNDMWKRKLDPNTKAYKLYEAFANDLKEQANLLAAHGLNSVTHPNLMNMRSRYVEDISPINDAWRRLDEIKKLQYEDNKASGGTSIFEREANDISIDDLMEDPQYLPRSISGQALEKQMAALVQGLANQLTGYGQGKPLDDYTNTFVKQYGLTPAKLAKALSDPDSSEYGRFIAQAKEYVLSSSGIRSWNNPDAVEKATAYLDMGAHAAIGKSDVERYDNFINRLNAKTEHEKKGKDKTENPVKGNNIALSGNGIKEADTDTKEFQALSQMADALSKGLIAESVKPTNIGEKRAKEIKDKLLKDNPAATEEDLAKALMKEMQIATLDSVAEDSAKEAKESAMSTMITGADGKKYDSTLSTLVRTISDGAIKEAFKNKFSEDVYDVGGKKMVITMPGFKELEEDYNNRVVKPKQKKLEEIWDQNEEKKNGHYSTSAQAFSMMMTSGGRGWNPEPNPNWKPDLVTTEKAEKELKEAISNSPRVHLQRYLDEMSEALPKGVDSGTIVTAAMKQILVDRKQAMVQPIQSDELWSDEVNEKVAKMVYNNFRQNYNAEVHKVGSSKNKTAKDVFTTDEGRRTLTDISIQFDPTDLSNTGLVFNQGGAGQYMLSSGNSILAGMNRQVKAMAATCKDFSSKGRKYLDAEESAEFEKYYEQLGDNAFKAFFDEAKAISEVNGFKEARIGVLEKNEMKSYNIVYDPQGKVVNVWSANDVIGDGISNRIQSMSKDILDALGLSAQYKPKAE